MLQLGKINSLKAFRKTDFGWILINREADEVLLPNRFSPKNMKPGDTVQAFVYKDSEDRPVCTTQTPKTMVNEFACLRVKEVSNVGAFLDWGLDKDLFLPFREQKKRVSDGEWSLVYVFLDEKSERIVATNNIGKYIQPADAALKVNDPVDILIADDINIGIRTVINNKYLGLLFKNEIFGDIAPGMHVKGYVKKLREDGKVDVALQKQGIQAAKDVKELLLEKLIAAKGLLKLSDDSTPEEIYEHLGISKKNFKKAVGMLYKEGKVIPGDSYIKLAPEKK
ncbi:MAG: GntR family transcriptional regulator [Bacteroidetes bacterium]|nr:GntR family transcriptional regulator [Bacteroidota bacterium]